MINDYIILLSLKDNVKENSYSEIDDFLRRLFPGNINGYEILLRDSLKNLGERIYKVRMPIYQLTEREIEEIKEVAKKLNINVEISKLEEII